MFPDHLNEVIDVSYLENRSFGIWQALFASLGLKIFVLGWGLLGLRGSGS